MTRFKTKLLKAIGAVLIWFLIWFVLGIPYSTSWLLPNPTINVLSNISSSRTEFFALYSLWVLLITAIAIMIYKFTINDFSFLKIKQKKLLFLYLIPVILAAYDILANDTYGINSYIWAIGIATTTFCGQDLLTFGLLQTYLSKVLNPFAALIITSAAFFVAHLFIGYNNLSLATSIVLFGAFLFGFLRYKSKSIYLLDVIHIAFGLLP
jgi:membrane protease YdiL (CAAX protease family)